MIEKTNLKNKAIKLREEGKTYSEILEKVPVAKSTLSLWLREVGLSKPQKQRITKKRIEASLRGAKKRKDQRIELTKAIYEKAEKEIGKISKRELWLIGIALYWAEGSKEKENKPGSCVGFGNTDPHMIFLFLKWLMEICGLEKRDIKLNLYIHENNRHRTEEVLKYWIVWTGFPKINNVYYKKHNIKTLRKNIGKDYFGLLDIRVKASSKLVRKIRGWTRGINKNYCQIV